MERVPFTDTDISTAVAFFTRLWVVTVNPNCLCIDGSIQKCRQGSRSRLLRCVLGDTLLHSTHAFFKVILVYDHVLSLRREISHVWRLRFSLPKLLFLLVSNPFVIYALHLIQGLDPIPPPAGILPRPSFNN
jgi:hypothetical protein